MTNHTVKHTADTLRRELLPFYAAEEAEALVFRTLQHVLKMSRSYIYLHPDANVPKTAVSEIEKITIALKKFEPLQYILGETSFYGLEFRVNSNVLIPRPETEELVDWILRDNALEGLKVIDLGTGSGCIAVSVAKNRLSWEVTAADISSEALKVAAQNAALNNTGVTFVQEDMQNLSAGLRGRKFDLILSNPPYVTLEQKDEMLPNVLDYEPHLALFAPGPDPLIFYRAIAAFADTNLEKNGKVYVEINEDFAEKSAAIFEEKGFVTEIAKDIHGKNRMLKAYRND
jgi:release factor glutamine methyltransferase